MSAILLVVIYFIFISLGLPDSFMGSCWPSISESLNVSESFQGVLSIVICIFTVFSAFASGYFQKKYSTHLIVTVSTLLTVIGLVGIFFAPSIVLMIVAMLPLGLGAGAIDAVLNNYVSNHYKATQLHFLHGCWSTGALITPLIASFFLVNPEGWRNAILVLAIIQTIILLITFISKSLWNHKIIVVEEEKNKNISIFDTVRVRGCIYVLLVLFLFCGMEALIFSWFSSMMVFSNDVNPDLAASWLSFVYLGYTISRIISGLLSNKISDRKIIRIFAAIAIIGIGFLMFNKNIGLTPIATFIIGFGMGPIYPAVVHDTSSKFGKALSGNVLSLQIGFAYLSFIIVGPLFGVVGENFGFHLLPYVFISLMALMLLFFELSNIVTKDKSKLLDKTKNKK